MEQLTTFLSALAAKLGVATAMLWQAMVYQAHIAGIVSIIQYVIIGILFFPLRILWKTVIRKVHKDEWDGIVYIFPIIGTVIYIVLCITAFFSLEDTFTAFMNPQYWAFHHIVRQFKGS